MRFLRLAVSHYKGIRHLDVRFAPTGITLVEGRNEIGKSSLVQALTTLFDEPVTRTRAKLGHLIPKDGGGTPDISLEAESGPYRFTYRKSFIENKIVELHITAPHVERLAGKEAQERIERILHETLDRTLWRALMLQQGTAVGLPEVEDQKALMTALDSAVSGPGGTHDVESLYARVTEEYGKYYHAGHGGELQTLRALREDRDAAEAAVRDLETRLRELERKVAKARQLRLDIRTLGERETMERRRHGESAEALAEVERLERIRDAEKAKRDQAAAARAVAARELDDRRRLAASVDAADNALGQAERDVRDAETAEAEAAGDATEKKTVLDRLDEERTGRERTAALRRGDYEHLHDALELERLREHRDRMDAASIRVRDAKLELARNTVTEAVAREIRAAESAVDIARARLDAAAPRLRVTALGACSITADGEALRLAPGETRDAPVAGSSTVEVPGVLRVEVAAGESADALARQLAEAEKRLRAALEAQGVADAADIPGLVEKRREAERVIADHQRAATENPRESEYGGDAGGLADRIRELEAALPEYLRGRPDGEALPADLDAARRGRDQAETELREATARRVEAEAAWKEAETRRAAAVETRIRAEAGRESAAREAGRIRLLLEESRGGAGDESLAAALEKTEKDVGDAAAALAGVEDKLRELGADLLRPRLTGLEAAMQKTERERNEAREQLARLGGELEQLGASGLDERLEEARGRLEHASKLLAATLRKAEAARLLYTVVSEARERSQRNYVLPLKKRIEDLARSVYAADVRVTLNADLRIASRAIDGVDIDFAELSGGAREQFSLIHRAACSLAVAGDGGVPLILDDALGYSDTERLLGMNEVLARAAQQCQIIILTCMPSRYAYLEPAARIDLEMLNPKER